MGAIADALAAAALTNTLAIHGQPLLILSGADAGKTFRGALVDESSTELAGLLGEDGREMCMAYFPRPGPDLESADRLRDTDNQVWQVVKRHNNSAQPSVDFEVVRIVGGKDT